MTLKDYLYEWLESYKIQLSYNTIRGYEVNIRHIIRYIGNVELAELTYSDIQKCYKELLKTLSGTSVLYCHRVLRSALHHAERLDFINKNPCDFVYPPRKNKPHIKILDEKQLQKLLTEISGTWLYNPVMLSAVLGLRRGEVLALRWSDVDFRRNVIYIEYSAMIVDNQFTLSTVKTDKSHRMILISDVLSDYLYHYMACVTRSEYVCSRYNKPISPNVLDKYFRLTVDRLGLPRVRFHDLRHTNATLLLQKGIPVKVVSERLGHSSVSITLDTYSHMLLDMQKDSSEAFDNLI